MYAQSSSLGIAPHGGALVDLASGDGRSSKGLPSVEITSRNLSDLYLLATGAFSPLRGFMRFDDARSIVERLELNDGALWPIPILLQLSSLEAEKINAGATVALSFNGTTVGTIRVEERFRVPLSAWASAIYKTADSAHPGVDAFLRAGEMAIAGPVTWLGDARELGLTGLTPIETRAEAAKRGWSTLVGFQTRNPIHRAHEYILRTALETIDGLLLHPLVGDTRGEDVPADVRLRCYDVLIENYLPQSRVLFSTFHGWMRYGGPREAVLHAIVRKNFGCTHFLVGRDHAGVGKYYGPFEAQALLRSIPAERLGIRPIFFDAIFYCMRCQSMATSRTCAHSVDHQLSLSGTEVRRRLNANEPLPQEVTRPEVAAVLRESYRQAAVAGA
ncbi:MAG TPA: sulfate adenylyltransferase [Thermoanaerobaculia bacterium]|nr:sulfate adenylyltransferase [Thermoanaerobaculia bacterium]